MTVSKIQAKCTFFIAVNVLVFILYEKRVILDGKASEIQMREDNDDTKSIISLKETEYDDNVRKDFGSIDLRNASYPDSISEICSRYNLSTENLVKRHYLLGPENTSLYCWIRKVASTSFTKIYSDSRNRKVTRDYYKEIDILSPKTVDHLKTLINEDKVFKFLIVRHPFGRIVSSFRYAMLDCLEKQKKLFPQDDDVMGKMKSECSPKLKISVLIKSTFELIDKHCRDRIEDNTKYTAQSWIYVPQIFHLTRPDLFYTNKSTGNLLSRIFDKDRRLKLVPSFKEFITWLLQKSTSSDDVHWDSFYSHCSICSVNYDYVMKLENYSYVDMDFILSKIGSIRNKKQIHKLRLEKTRGGLTDFKVTCKYLKTLTPEMVLKLYQRYKIDFLSFDYSYENYLECIQN